MSKSLVTTLLLAATLLFSVTLNSVHAYEHHDAEQHSVECEICSHLSNSSDSIQAGSIMPAHVFAVFENYLFIVNNNFLPSPHSTHPRAPPHVHTIT